MMASSIQILSQLPSDPSRVDHLSNLPNELIVSILSYLKTHEATCTSLLSRRFRHLWESCTSLDIGKISTPSDMLVAMANRALLQRDPARPILSLCLHTATLSKEDQSLRTSLISSWLVKARHLGVHHLSICDSLTANLYYLEAILPIIFSIGSLKSLYLQSFMFSKEYTLPSAITLTSLKSLHCFYVNITSAKFNRLLSELGCLEDLHLELMMVTEVSLSSKTIRKLKLTTYPKICLFELSMPSLELLHYETSIVPWIHGDIPKLRKAVFIMEQLSKSQRTVDVVSSLLENLSHVEELILNITEFRKEKYPYPILLKPGNAVPTFSRMKYLEVTACIHDFNLESIITLLHHSPALESVRLVHKIPCPYTFGENKRKKKDWASKLPRNADGNRCYAYFTNLHLGKNNEEFIKLLNKKCSTPERKRMKPQGKKKKCAFLKNRGL